VSTVALDLGSTRIKLARLGADGALAILAALDAPRPRGDGAVREFDADQYRRAAESLTARIERGSRLGIASQRSTFVLWERASGVPVAPAISWQDRRAAAWCDAHARLEGELREASGLPLSPHYAGPKLAVVLDARPDLRERMRRGEILFGTLETYLVWHWSERRAHETDLSMAARTLLVDARRRAWSESACAAFGVPREALPKIAATSGRDTRLAGDVRLACSIADQASGLLAMAPESDAAALVNLGTGCFVLRPTGASFECKSGYLSGPLRGDGERASFALEGTINGGGASVERFGNARVELGAFDAHPEAFCLPDDNGVGAPHWRAMQPFELSPAARVLALDAQRAIVLEGLVFRVCEILGGLFDDRPPARVLLSGGLAREPFVASTLATCLQREIEVASELESTLLGAARLAAGLDPCARSATRIIEPVANAAWLRAKYERWRAWLARTLVQ
jgi:glycerol kinase